MVDSVNSEQVQSSEEDEVLKSVLSDIEQSESINTKVDEEPEGDEADNADDPKDEKSPNAKTPAERNQGKSQASIRIQQLVDRAKSAEARNDVLLERLNYANEKIADLQETIKQYEIVVAEIEQLKHSMFSSDNKQEDIDLGGEEALSKLTPAQVKQLTIDAMKEEEERRKSETQKSLEAKRQQEENSKFMELWAPHLTRLKNSGASEATIGIMREVFSDIDADKEKQALLKVVGKYQYAPEILVGLHKQKGFADLSLAEKIESAVRLKDKINQAKSGAKKQDDEGQVSLGSNKQSKDVEKYSSYEDYYRAKHKK